MVAAQWRQLFGLLARELHLRPAVVGDLEWWEAEDVLADMKEHPSVQVMLQGLLLGGVKKSSPKVADRATVQRMIAAMGRKG